MGVIGALLALATAAFTADVVVENTGHAVRGQALHQNVTGLSTGGLFVAGAVTGLLFAIGLALLFSGAGRARRRRLERRAAVQRAETLAAERNELEQRLEQERANRGAEPYPQEPVATAGGLRGRFGRGGRTGRDGRMQNAPVQDGTAQDGTAQDGTAQDEAVDEESMAGGRGGRHRA